MDDACCRQMARNTTGAKHPAKFKKLSNIAKALLHEHGFVFGSKNVHYLFKNYVGCLLH